MYPTTFYRVSVKALIKNPDGHILVVKENQDTWSLPGGGLDHGETPEDGIRRELKEELGIDNANILGINHIRTFDRQTKPVWLLWVVYDVTIDADDFTLGEGVTDSRYIDPTTLRDSEDVFEQQVYRIAVDLALINS